MATMHMSVTSCPWALIVSTEPWTMITAEEKDYDCHEDCCAWCFQYYWASESAGTYHFCAQTANAFVLLRWIHSLSQQMFIGNPLCTRLWSGLWGNIDEFPFLTGLMDSAGNEVFLGTQIWEQPVLPGRVRTASPRSCQRAGLGLQ